jgi:hypothetical protein
MQRAILFVFSCVCDNVRAPAFSLSACFDFYCVRCELCVLRRLCLLLAAALASPVFVAAAECRSPPALRTDAAATARCLALRDALAMRPHVRERDREAVVCTAPFNTQPRRTCTQHSTRQSARAALMPHPKAVRFDRLYGAETLRIRRRICHPSGHSTN